MTSYKISNVTSKYTYVREYWDDIHVFTWRVSSCYHGGSIEDFLVQNNSVRNPIFDGIDEFHRRTFILDL